METGKIGIIGAGLMGVDTALDFVFHGYKVILKDISSNVLKTAEQSITNKYRFYKMMRNEKVNILLEEVMESIILTTTYEDFCSLDLIIENITENIQKKIDVFYEINEFLKPTDHIGINSSSISINNLSNNLKYPKNVIGLHFMNPVPMKKVVEVIKGEKTSRDTILFIEDLLKKINKIAVIVNDSPGFVVNRLSHLFMNEACRIVEEKIAEPKQVDLLFKEGYGHKMGPLETIDLIGVDTVVNTLDSLYEQLKDEKFKCCTLLRDLVDKGFLGIKSKKGFYQY